MRERKERKKKRERERKNIDTLIVIIKYHIMKISFTNPNNKNKVLKHKQTLINY